MPRSRLRTLLILMTVVPLLVAFFAWALIDNGNFPFVPATLTILSIVVGWRARQAGRNPLAWVVVVWILGYAVAILFTIIAVTVAIRVSTTVSRSQPYLDALQITTLSGGAICGAFLALFGAGRPLRQAPADAATQ